MASDKGFVLINSDKHIVGLSSSCIKLINLDCVKLRRYQQQGIDIEKLAPTLFLNENQDTSSTALDWFLPESLDKKKRHEQRKKRKTHKKSEKEKESPGASDSSQMSVNVS